MKRNILLPTDFSENAWSAILYALNLYKNESCTFYFLHSCAFLNTGSRTYITPNYIDTLKEQSKQTLITLKDRAEALNVNSNHEFEIIFSSDSLSSVIKTSIIKYQINMLIMGTQGATGAKEIIFGSNTVSIINKIKNCPVLIVPNNYDFVKPDAIAFPTDFNRDYGDELNPLIHLSQLNNSNINILHIKGKNNLTNKQNYNLAMLEERLEKLDYNYYKIPDLGKKELVIKNFIEEFDIKILVMINYKHSFIENIIKEPVIKKLGFHTLIPFLVIPSLD